MNYYDVKLYAPEDVIFVIAGYTLANWNSIAIKRDTPRFTTIKGIRGKNARVYNKDSSASIDIGVPVSSEVNELFTQIHEIDMSTGTARVELSIKDMNNGILFSSNEGYIPTYPDLTFEEESGIITWTINCLSSNGGVTDKTTLSSLLNETATQLSSQF